jgi:uncharacterized protein involved in exopolysaccharide biosynthesis
MSPLFGRTPLGRTSNDDEVTVRLNRQHERIAELERELARVSPQLAGLEERVAALATPPPAPDLGTVLSSDDPGAAELLAAIRAEHARVRARISAAAKYEERLRQLEETVARLTAGTR